MSNDAIVINAAPRGWLRKVWRRRHRRRGTVVPSSLPAAERCIPHAAGSAAPHAMFALPIVLLMFAFRCTGVEAGIDSAPSASWQQGTASPVSVYLVGDAGRPGDQVLRAVEQDMRERVSRLGANNVAILFLGDNIYPAGMPDCCGSEHETARARLDRQASAALRSGAGTIVFVPGNHDWNDSESGGLARVRNQQRVLAEYGPRVLIRPTDGCAGPASVRVGSRVELILLNTQWWLHAYEKPRAVECPHGTEEAVLRALAAKLDEGEERYTIVAAHHPLMSGGPHATNAVNNAQDLDHRTYRGMRDRIQSVLRTAPPEVWASGHEHTLEVLRGTSASFLLVSGAGSFGYANYVRPGAKTRDETWIYPRSASRSPNGFMRLDVPAGSSPARLSVISVDSSARRRTVLGITLDPEETVEPPATRTRAARRR